MNKTIYLHIGMPKTATSSLQTFLYQNRHLLNRQGVLYPETGILAEAHHQIRSTLGISLVASTGFETDDKSEDAIYNLKNKLLKEIELSAQNKIVISSAGFFYAKTTEQFDRIKNFFDGFPVKVIVYLRRHDLWYESFYNQHSKILNGNFNSHSIDDYIEATDENYHYFKILSTWANYFGQENIIVKVFEKEQMQEGIYANFLAILGVALEKDFVLPKKNINSTLSNDVLSLIKTLKEMKIESTLKEKFYHALLSFPVNSHYLLPLLSPDIRLKLIQRNQDDYQKIARIFLNREKESLFYAALPDLQEQWQSEAELIKAAKVYLPRILELL